MTRWLVLPILSFVAVGIGGAGAQDVDMPDRRVIADAPTADPALDAHLAFHADLEAIPADRARALRLDAARRMASVDLGWGLED